MEKKVINKTKKLLKTFKECLESAKNRLWYKKFFII